MILILVNIFRYEQERILQKRHQKQQLQPSLVTQKYLDNIWKFEGSWSNLPDY